MAVFERYAYHFSRWWWLAVFITSIAAVTSYSIAKMSPGDYRASATLFVNLAKTPGTVDLNDVLASERLVNTYRELVTTGPILDVAAARLEGRETADSLRPILEVFVVPQTQLIRVTARSDDSTRAATIANAVASAFAEETNAQTQGAFPGTVSVVASAEPPQDREGPSVPMRGLLGALAGFSLFLVIVIGKTYFDRSIWDSEDLEGITPHLQPLAVIPMQDSDPKNHPRGDSRLPLLTEHHRALAANVLAAVGKARDAGKGGAITIGIMSAVGGEGRTTTAARLGFAAALDGHRVTLVDFDLRNPSLHLEFNLPNKGGVGEWLSSMGPPGEADADGEFALEGAGPEMKRSFAPLKSAGGKRGSASAAGFAAYVEATAMEGLTLVPAGHHRGTAVQLSTVRVRAVVDQLIKDDGDLIILDAPPFGDGPDAMILGQMVDGVVLVAEARRTTVEQVASVASQMDSFGPPILGVVINKR